MPRKKTPGKRRRLGEVLFLPLLQCILLLNSCPPHRHKQTDPSPPLLLSAFPQPRRSPALPMFLCVYPIQFYLAGFGPPAPLDEARLVWAEPRDACGSLSNSGLLSGAIVLAERGSCSFVDKVHSIRDTKKNHFSGGEVKSLVKTMCLATCNHHGACRWSLRCNCRQTQWREAARWPWS